MKSSDINNKCANKIDDFSQNNGNRKEMEMFYPEEIIEEVRQRNDIVDIISSYVKLKKTGSNYMGLCPFHSEKSPSFSVSGSKQMYHCFGCGVGGNVFTFVMEYENYSFVEAVQYLADRSGVQLPKVEMTPEAKRQADIRNRILEVNKEAAKYYVYQLHTRQGQKALDYLKGRELSDDTILKFGLGFSNKYSDDLYQYMKKKGFDDSLLKETGLFTMDEKRGVNDKFWNRVIFPIMDMNSKVIGFGGRVMGDGKPKYLNSPETKAFDKSRNLYGLHLARQARSRSMILCEGYMDVIAMHQAGFSNAVASLGTAFTGLQANLLKRFADEVLLLYDSDEAGIKAALRAIPILKEAGLPAKVVRLKPYKDPDEFIKAQGKEAFQKRLDEAMNSFYFEIEVLEQNFDLQDPEGKTKFFNEIAKKLLQFTEKLERNNYIEAIARKYRIAYADLEKLVNHYGAQMVMVPDMEKRVQREQRNQKKEDGLREAQKIFLTWLIEEQELFYKLSEFLSEKDFMEEPYHTVAAALFEQFRAKEQVNPAKIINQFESKEEQSEVASMFNRDLSEELTKQEKERALNETVLRIKSHSLEYRKSHATDISELQNIIKEQAELQKLHISL
ncbi:dNA primase [Clostridium sp. CAG:411]|jgi:DNA primase|nr:dNA primase [Clostridium sp. CAG:411]